MKKKILTFLLAASMIFASLPIVNAADASDKADTTKKVETAAATPTPKATSKATATPKASATPKATPTPTPPALDPEHKWGFKDVPEDSINGEAVLELAKKGIINGYNDKTFKPENNVTRAEFVKMLVEFAGWGSIYADGVTTGFPDVDAADGKEAHWAAKYIKVVASQKIVNGYEDGNFRPDNQVKYEEAMKMIVCYLGRDGVAQNRVQTNPETKLYPDAYMFVGNNLGLSKLVSSKIGDYINRAMVAQIIYNSTGIERLQVPTAVGNNNKKPSPYNPGPSNNNSKKIPGKESGVDGSGKISGMIVAVKTSESYDDTIMRIDDDILTYDNEDGSELKKSQIIIKVDNPSIDGYYYLRIDNASNLSDYLGYYIRGTYTYYSEDDVYELFDVDMSETEVFSYTSEDINRDKTLENISEDTVYFYSNAGKKNYKIPENFADLNIIYNGRMIDMSSADETETEGEGSSEEGGTAEEEGSSGEGAAPEGEGSSGEGTLPGGDDTGEESDSPITIYDFIPADGDVEIVEYEGEIKLIRINSYEMYYVKKINASTKVVDDKFRINGDGTPVTVNLKEEDDNIIYIEDMTKSGEDKSITVTALKENNVLRVRQSKCGTLTYVRKEKTSSEKLRLKSVNGKIYMLSGASSASGIKEYVATDYFCDFVWPDLELEIDIEDTATIYFVDTGSSDGKKITNMVKSAAEMQIGYLASATKENDVSGDIVKFKIHPVSSSPSSVKTQEPMEYEFYRKIKVDGVEYTSADAAITKLKEKAAIINEGKSSRLTSTAETSQPIRYLLDEGYVKEIETLQFNTETRYTTTSMRYAPTDNSGKMFIADDGETLSIPDNPIFMFVTNDRSGTSAPKYFKYSGISGLVENKKYNVEPYYLPKNTGEGSSQRLFVVYNQDIDATPTFMNNIVMVENVDEQESSYKLSVYNGTSKTTVTTQNRDVAERAYVLDENFARTGEKRAVQRGDVIRYGEHINGNILNIEILYNAQLDLENVKALYVNTANEEVTDFAAINGLNVATQETNIRHLTKVGMVSDNSIGVEDKEITISYLVPDGNGGYRSYRKSDGFTKTLGNITIVLYDLTSEDRVIRPKTAKMSDLLPGDMVFLWRGEKNQYKGMYAVRYDEDIQGKYEALLAGTYGQDTQLLQIEENDEMTGEPELSAVSEQDEETVETEVSKFFVIDSMTLTTNDEGEEGKVLEGISSDEETTLTIDNVNKADVVVLEEIISEEIQEAA